MSNPNVIQIPNLPPITAFNGSELFQVVQAGVSCKASISQLASYIGIGGGGGGVTSITAGAAIGVNQPTGPVTITNGGVTSLAAGTGVSVSQAAGAVTIGNTGVTSIIAGANVSISSSTGAVTISASTGGGGGSVVAIAAGTGISISGPTGTVTITNAGVTSLAAGSGISLSATTGGVTVSAVGPTVSSTSSTSYTAVIGDANGYKRMTAGTAASFTVPPNASVAFPLNTTLTLEQSGAGQVTVAAGVGVTINASGGKMKSAAQYAVMELIQTATDVWTLFGERTT